MASVSGAVFLIQPPPGDGRNTSICIFVPNIDLPATQPVQSVSVDDYHGYRGNSAAVAAAMPWLVDVGVPAPRRRSDRTQFYETQGQDHAPPPHGWVAAVFAWANLAPSTDKTHATVAWPVNGVIPDDGILRTVTGTILVQLTSPF